MTEQSSSIRYPPLGGDEGKHVSPDDLAGTVVTSLKWKFASQILREGVRLAVAVVLARILTPDEWGLATMALVVTALLELVPDSITGGLVQRPRITERDRSTIFWTTVGLGVSVATLGVAASGLIADFFGEPDAQELIAAACVGLGIMSIGVVPEALLIRDLQYRSLELRQMAATLVGAAVALTLAFSGAGAWAIVGNALAVVTTSTIMLWVFVQWRPHLVFSRGSFTSLGTYGIRMLGTQVLTYAQVNGDKLLVGRYLGAASLGIYGFAFNLMFAPIVNIAYPIQHVLFPAYSTIQADDERLRAAWLRGKRLAVAALAPIFLTVLVVAPDLVRVVFGTKWEDAIPVLQLLSVAGLGYSLVTQNPTLLLVRDRMQTLLRWSSIATLSLLTGIAIGLQWGVIGVAVAYAIVQWLLVLPDTWVTTRSASIPLGRALRAATAALPLAVAAAALAFALRLALVEAGVPAALRLIAIAPAVVSLYIALVWLLSPTLRDEARDAIALARGREPEPLAEL